MRDPDLFIDLITPKEGARITLHSDQRIFLRSITRFFSVYGVFSRGFSKCVTGDTVLFTENGLKEIGSYFNYQDDDNETYIASKIKLLNRYGELESTNAGVYSGFKPTKKIRTEEGYKLEGTLNHPVLVMSEDGLVEWRNIEDIKVGDYIVINRKNEVWGNKFNIDCEKELDKWFNSLSNQRKAHLNKREMPKIMTEDLALIFGYLVGDGCLTISNRILFSNKDEDIIDKYSDAMESYFGSNVIKIKGDNVDYVVNDIYLRKYLDILGLEQVNAFGKSVPKCILEAPKGIVSKFLQGLFDTDGTVDTRLVSLCTVSETLANQVQLLLLNYGIISVVARYESSDSFYYDIRICGENINIFNDNIGFGCERKQQKLNKLLNVQRNTNKDVLPYQKNNVLEFCNQAKLFNKAVKSKVYHVLTGANNLTYPKLKYLLDLNKAEDCPKYNELKKLADCHYFYSKVKTVEDSENHVYDLSLPETHSFVSNGFVSHNTYLEVLAMIIIAIRYPYIELSLTAQTKENAAEILKDKILEILKHFPLLENEIYSKKFSQNDAEVVLVNGSRIDMKNVAFNSNINRKFSELVDARCA